MYRRLALMLLMVGAGLAGPLPAAATILIKVQPDGGVLVLAGDGSERVIPADAVSALELGLLGQEDPAAVEATVAEVVQAWTESDPVLATAIAAYALTLVPEGLGTAVIAGAQAGNPEAAGAIAVAVGPARSGSSSGVWGGAAGSIHLGIGGIGGSTAEVQNASPTTL